MWRRTASSSSDSIVAEEITKDSEYKGTRILMDGRMDKVRLRIQIDFGVGDVMVPGPRIVEYPAYLASDTIHLLAYPIESAIAEKLQAMVALGSANSRVKDFYDVWMCSKHLDFEADALLNAIEATFNNRETPVPAEEFEALTASFAEQHRIQWNAFVKKLDEPGLANAFDGIVADIRTFAVPALRSLARGEKLMERWKAGEGWVTS
ncbi:nucleotidyl transferase AbiEii/AbiGii toxin family protein [Steroidobacter sp. S1-65]|uniref:Nucleotidyl transferase AbiEii/AbiGii toxin family protein n=1 Tax=Steroidobacter gossypii TaxID=2805490 RepID=A0ABS1WRK7_9GAMM|nr:nucleotidyl transferase AbiEii/AbiGii toxin family protein [Steroidobacter gossypii]MBM0103608.1 nucleotidyl transferase AbiEii/AbiGii toxin family protein [Steroidobacter gossypii]